MGLNLLKLCVGCDSVEELEGWIEARLAQQMRAGQPREHRHTTRMIPTRREELLAGGSLYWVIRGQVQVRQQLLDIRPFRDADGIKRCHLVLDPALVATEWQPRRAFQGWRYLPVEDSPADLGIDRCAPGELPAELRRDLAELGLL